MALVLLLVTAGRSRGDELRDRAHSELTQAQADFEARKFESALDHLNRAYALVPHPQLLFNIARCLEELHRTAAAVDAYDRYLAVQPDDAVAQTRVAALREELRLHPPPPEVETKPTPPAVVAEPPPAIVTVQAPPPPPARKPLYRRWWVWTAVGGVVAVGVGVGLGVGLTRSSGPATFPPLTAQ